MSAVIWPSVAIIHHLHCHLSLSMSAVGSSLAVRLHCRRTASPRSTFVVFIVFTVLFIVFPRAFRRGPSFIVFVLFIYWLWLAAAGGFAEGARTVLPCLGSRPPRLHWVGFFAAVRWGALAPPRPRCGSLAAAVCVMRRSRLLGVLDSRAVTATPCSRRVLLRGLWGGALAPLPASLSVGCWALLAWCYSGCSAG